MNLEDLTISEISEIAMDPLASEIHIWMRDGEHHEFETEDVEQVFKELIQRLINV